MKKMATQFQTWKKHLYNTYIKKNETPNWVTATDPISKQRAYWNDFVQYKTSAEGEARVRRNQENAQKRYTTMTWDQVATILPFRSGKK